MQKTGIQARACLLGNANYAALRGAFFTHLTEGAKGPRGYAAVDSREGKAERAQTLFLAPVVNNHCFSVGLALFEPQKRCHRKAENHSSRAKKALVSIHPGRTDGALALSDCTGILDK